MTKCSWQRLQIEVELKNVENRKIEKWIRIENWRERFPRACVDLKISNSIVSKADEIVAFRYDVTRVVWGDHCFWDCICQNCAKNTRAFDVAADSLISTSQETCDADHSRSDEILIEDLKVDDEVSESAISECRLRLLDGNSSLLSLVVCSYSSSFLTHRAEIEDELRCHVDDRLDPSAEWQLTSVNKIAVSYRT